MMASQTTAAKCAGEPPIQQQSLKKLISPFNA